VVWWWMMLACWQPSVWEPPAGASGPPTWYELSVDGSVVGAEAWWWLGSGERHRRRHTRWRVAGVEQVAVHDLRLRETGDGWERVLDGGEPRPVGLIPDMVRVDGAGVRQVVDAFGSASVVADVVVHEGRQHTAGPLGPTWASFDGGGLVEAELGRQRLRRVETLPDWEPVDLVELVRRPVADWGDVPPRRARVAHWRVDGERIVVHSPLEAELPSVPLAAGAGSPPHGPVEAWAEDVVRRDATTWAAVRSLSAAVAETVSHHPRGGPSDAATVLEERRGDCTERVALFVAAAEAVGVSARTVTGWLVQARPEGGGWRVPHAWAEVSMGGRWVAVDPSLGTAPADAARLPLGRGPGAVGAAWVAPRAASLETLR